MMLNENYKIVEPSNLNDADTLRKIADEYEGLAKHKEASDVSKSLLEDAETLRRIAANISNRLELKP